AKKITEICQFFLENILLLQSAKAETIIVHNDYESLDTMVPERHTLEEFQPPQSETFTVINILLASGPDIRIEIGLLSQKNKKFLNKMLIRCPDSEVSASNNCR
ncbi:MAG: hypothetical protein Q8O32_00645, partial [bacterium]|nr:hypothetical protein [bacterium]